MERCDWTLEHAKAEFYAIFSSGIDHYMMANCMRCLLELYYEGVRVDVNCPSTPFNDTPLLLAIRTANVHVVRVLLEFDANPNLCRMGYNFCGSDKITPLHQAVRTHPYKDGLAIMEMLLAKGASVYSLDDSHETILHYICKNHIGDITKHNTDLVLGKIDQLDLVLNNIEDTRLEDMLNCRNIHGAIPLHTAILFNRCDIAAELIARGSNLDIQNNLGYSSLNWAVLNLPDDANRHTPGELFTSEFIVERMILNGANIELETNIGKTPLCTAINPSKPGEPKERPKIWAIMLLLQHGANANDDNVAYMSEWSSADLETQLQLTEIVSVMTQRKRVQTG
jgi:ankyrin repeat protein